MVVVNQQSEGSPSSIDEIATSKDEELKLVMIRLYKRIMWPIIHLDGFEVDNNGGLGGSTSSIDELSKVVAAQQEEMESMIRIYKETICPMIYAEINAKHQNFLSVIGEKFGVNLLTGMPWKFGNTASTSGSKVYQLKFINGISSPVSTRNYIKGKDDKPFVLALVDVISGEIVSSSMEVELVVLKVDSNENEAQNWTSDEFNNKVVREWNGTKVLQGNTFVNLKEGSVIVDKISFTHNAIWKGIRNYRVGARPANVALYTCVKEAITELVRVTDKRNLMYKKHPIPSLFDNVYHLYKISSRSERYKRLSEANIKTVMDLLTLNAINPKRLKEILIVRANTWKIIINHAQMCKDDNGIYLYYYPRDGHNGVVFNISGQLVGLIAESQFVPCDKLPRDKKTDAQKLILSSSENWNDVISYSNLTSLFKDFQPNTTLNSFPYSLNVVIPQTIDTTSIFPIGYTNNESNLGYSNIDVVRQSQSQSPKRPASGNVISISPKKRRDNHFPMSPSTPSVSASKITNTNVYQCRKPDNSLTPATSEDDDCSQFLDFSMYDIPAQRWKMVWRVVGWISIFSKVRKRRMSFCDQLLQTSDDDETVFVIATSIEHLQG